MHSVEILLHPSTALSVVDVPLIAKLIFCVFQLLRQYGWKTFWNDGSSSSASSLPHISLITQADTFGDIRCFGLVHILFYKYRFPAEEPQPLRIDVVRAY